MVIDDRREHLLALSSGELFTVSKLSCDRFPEAAAVEFDEL
jgi:hypothetical protein